MKMEKSNNNIAGKTLRLRASAVIFFPILILHLHSFAQTTQLIQQAHQLDQAANEEGALQKYLEVLKLDAANYEATWNTSFMYSKIGNRVTESTKQKEYFNTAKQYALKALQLDSNNAESNYVMAVALGRMALVSAPKEKVAASRAIKHYAERAIAINPKHAGAWYVLGKWNYEVVNLNWAEQAAAKYLYGGIPEASLNDAIKDYVNAVKYEPDYILYYRDLCYALEQAGLKSQAIDLLNKAIAIPPRWEDDPTYLQQCSDLLTELKK